MQGPVLQPFSYDEAHPYASGQHRGMDIGADAAGETVVAPAAGTVSFAGTVPTNGKTVTIETADGYSVTLTHLGSIAIAKGATVAEQDVVGTIGPSGTPEVDGPYVHLGIRVTADPNGYVDPLGLLPPAPESAATQTVTTAPQPVSSGVSAVAPASKPAPSAPRKPRVASARGTRAEPVRSQVRVHHRERAQRPRAQTGRTRVAATPGCPRSCERADDELFPAADRRAAGFQAYRSRRQARDPAERVRRAAASQAVQSAARARLQLGRRAVRARCGVRRATATLEYEPNRERPGPSSAAAGRRARAGVARGLT